MNYESTKYENIKTDTSETSYFRNKIEDKIDISQDIQVKCQHVGPGMNHVGNLYNASVGKIKLYEASDYLGPETDKGTDNYIAKTGDGINHESKWENIMVMYLTIDADRLEPSKAYTLVYEEEITTNPSRNHSLGKDVTFTFTTKTVVESVELNKESTELEIGKDETLTATVNPEGIEQAVEWSSDNDDVATVDENGKVTAVSVGKANITATSTADQIISASCEVTVVPVKETGITLDKTEIVLKPNQTETRAATIEPQNAGDTTVEWTSDNPDVATVDNNGAVTAVAPGEATITAMTVNGLTATCKVTVTADPAAPAVPGDNGGNDDTENNDKATKTGDNMNLWALFAAMIIAAGGAGVVVYRRKARQ